MDRTLLTNEPPSHSVDAVVIPGGGPGQRDRPPATGSGNGASAWYNPSTIEQQLTDVETLADQSMHSADGKDRTVADALDLQIAPGESPTEQQQQQIAKVSGQLEAAQPRDILAWTAEQFGNGFTVATAFGAEGMLIIHWLAQVAPETRIFNLDTGYQFPETLEMVDRIRQRYGLQVELVRPELTVPQYEQLHNGPVYLERPDQCCRDRKLIPLQKRLQGATAWASAIRRDQSPDRAKAPIVGWDRKFGLVKVSPLANWNKSQVWSTILNEDVPYNPLHDQGYPSIGCQPCTRCILSGEDERAGRWSGSRKTECGLHTWS